MFSIGIYGQNFISDDLSLLKKTPEVSSLYNSTLHYVLLYENDVDSLTKALTYIDRAIVINPDISYSYFMERGDIVPYREEGRVIALVFFLMRKGILHLPHVVFDRYAV